jgi:hypothetical protein
MRVYLHIGVEKTGTSSIQRFFRINRDALKREGVLFPGSPGAENHMALAAAAQNDRKRDDLRIIHGLDSTAKIREFRRTVAERLMAESRDSGCQTVVFSGEHCSSRLTTPAEVDLLARMLRPLASDITIVVYLRRQDEFLCSTYSTDVKSGFSGRMEVPSPEQREERYNYQSLLQRWSSVFGKRNIVCRLFDRTLLKDGDVVADFLQLLGIERNDGYRQPERVNESLDINALEFLRLFNTTVPRFKDGKLNVARANVVRLLLEISKGPTATLPEAELAEFMRHFAESNARVAAEYFGRLSPEGDPLFGAFQANGNRAEMRPIPAETAVQLGARLWEEKQLQTAKLQERIAKLEGRPAGAQMPQS